MRKTGANNCSDAIMITSEQLMQKLNCGYQTAVTIGTNAKARVYIGRRVWYNVEKVEKYLKDIAI